MLRQIETITRGARHSKRRSTAALKTFQQFRGMHAQDGRTEDAIDYLESISAGFVG
jgi:hypothetical protein